jgi:hypothetical protein
VDLYELNHNTNDSAETILAVKWVIWALVLALGCLVACCLLKLALVVAGATAFGLVANLVYQLILSAGFPDFLYARLIVIIVFAIVGALLALQFLKFAFRLFTPVVGGFFCVAAVDHLGYVVGWWSLRPFFPRPEPRGQFFSHPDQFPWSDPKHAAGLLVLWIVLTIIGLVMQFLCARRRKKDVIVHETVVHRDEGPVHGGKQVEVLTQR